MSSLFIIGNGFDIAHNIPSTYGDFRKYIIRKYPNALKNRDCKVDINHYFDTEQGELATELLLNTMDNAAGKNWCDFENALASIDFNDKYIRAIHKKNETDEEDQQAALGYLMYMYGFTQDLIDCVEKCWPCLFNLWIYSLQYKIYSGKIIKRNQLSEFLKNQNTKILSFNYTSTVEELYDNTNIIHIHNQFGAKLLIGHGEEEPKILPKLMDDGRETPFFDSSDLEDMIMSFKKDTAEQMKLYKGFFDSLDSNIDKVYSYGFSYGKVDSPYIKKIISKISKDAVWYFTEFESKNSNELEEKKNKLIDYGFKGTFGMYEG